MISRRSLLLSIGVLATPAIARAQFFSDSPGPEIRYANPARPLQPGEMAPGTGAPSLQPPNSVGVVPPVGSGLEAYDRQYFDPNAPTEASVQNLRVPRWEKWFATPSKGMIVCSIEQRVVHYCSEDFSIQRAYLCSVPRSKEFERRGTTSIVEKRFEPTWIPTPEMRQRDPTLPERVGPGPDNPLGTRAMNLGWQYYRIHGIDKPEKVGQPVSSGCFGLYNHRVEELFEMVVVGTQVIVV